MANLTVAKTILQQLGGGHFIAMTGANNFAGDATSLRFQLPSKSGYVKSGINLVKITLDPSDTYTVEFWRLRGSKLTKVEKLTDIYCDMLQEVFTRTTGLETHL